jgi:fructose-1,6-bisphosphatase
VFDPLDGSSNIEAGVNIGTIFGIYRVVSVPWAKKKKTTETFHDQQGLKNKMHI